MKNETEYRIKIVNGSSNNNSNRYRSSYVSWFQSEYRRYFRDCVCVLVMR